MGFVLSPVDGITPVPIDGPCLSPPLIPHDRLSQQGFLCFERPFLATTSQLDVRYLWAKQVLGRWQIGAASFFDSTLFEFFRENGEVFLLLLCVWSTFFINHFSQPGAHLGASSLPVALPSIHQLDPSQLGGLPLKCGTGEATELVMLLDQQASIPFDQYLTYVTNMLSATLAKVMIGSKKARCRR